MKRIISHIKACAAHVHHCAHPLHGPAHLAYFVAVAVEAGKWYGVVAGGLALLTLAAMLSNEPE